MEAKVSISQVGVKYGIVSAVFSIVYVVLLYVTQLFLNPSMSFLSIVIAIAVYVFAFREYKANNGGYMTLGEGFKIGMIAVVISTVASALFNYIYVKFIDPTISDVIRDAQVAQFEKQGLSDEQIEQALSMASSFTTPEFSLLSGLIAGLIFGAVIVLIIAAIMKKNPETI